MADASAPPPADARAAFAWTPSRVAKLTAAVLLVYAAGRVIAAARDALLLSLLAVVLATVLCFPIDFMARKLPRWAAVLITLVLFVGVLTGAGLLVVPIVQDQFASLPGAIVEARDRVIHMLRHKAGGAAAAKAIATQTATAVPQHVLPLARGLVDGATAIIALIVLSFFLANERDALHAGVRRLVPQRHLGWFDEWWVRVAAALRRWTGGIVVSMTIMGVLCGVGLWIAGVEAPLLLGMLTFFGTFVPYVGAIASAIPGLAVALGQSPHTFFWALVVYIIVHHVEGYLVQPFIMHRAVKLRPAMLLFWEAVMALAFGIPGVIVATPLLAVIQVSVEYLWVERRLGKAT